MFSDYGQQVVEMLDRNAPHIRMEHLQEYAKETGGVTIALTDSRHRVIAFGNLMMGSTEEEDEIRVAIVDIEHGQSVDVRSRLHDILRNQA
jgi:sugar/nucleoside kinase (ribokinase family)